MPRNMVFLLVFTLFSGCAGSKAVRVGAGVMAGLSLEAPFVEGGEKLVVEAHATLMVPHLAEGVAEIRALVSDVGGRTVKDEVRLAAGVATFTFRVPPDQVNALLASLERIGTITDRRISAMDVTKTLVDNDIRVKNLEHALKRYREILAAATNVKEMLQVEAELTRILGEIEALEGEQAFLKDRVSLATVELTVLLDRTVAQFAPEAKFHPGVRLSHLAVFAPGDRDDLYGVGLSIHFHRASQFNLDVLSRPNAASGADAILATFATDLYSDFLGRGRRRYLNPHLGLAIGWAGYDGRGHFAAFATAGVELFKTDWLLIDANLRAGGLLGKGRNVTAVQSTLSVNIAF